MTNNQAFYYVDGIPTKGLWIDLDITDSTDEILDALADAELIDRDEYDGDLLVADIEGDLPRAFYTSSSDYFDLDGFVECRDECDGQEDAAAAFINWYGSWSKRVFEDAYQGQHKSEEDFAEQLVDDLGYLEQMPESLRAYFDYEKFARDLFINDYYFGDDGHVFNRNC